MMNRKVVVAFLASMLVAAVACTDLEDLPERDDRVLGEDDLNLVTTGCFDEQLPWDAQEQVSKCHLLVGYRDLEDCPSEVGSTEPYHSEDGAMLYCVVPKMAAPLNCNDVDWESYEVEDVGWYYCEDHDEDFDYNCEDGVDNDSDGFTDCDDDGCAYCPACGGDGTACDISCPWVLMGSPGLMQFMDDSDVDQKGVYCPGGTGSD